MNPGGREKRVVDGRFELLARLGGGGMGLVWRARDNALDREVALKEVRPADPAMAAADPAGARQMRERALREARALARLQHPNVVTIHHIVDGPEHPYPWLVMELVHGGSLADRLGSGPLAVPEAARIGRGVLSALRAAHAGGVQHRDVKPGNVLLRADGVPVLTDFGIADLLGATALTATGALIGSPEYIAPERIRGVEGDPASDFWSLGMMLYVAVEGRHPLRRATTLSTLAAVLDEPLPPPVRSGLLGPLLSALLVKDPAMRPDADLIDRHLAAAEHAAGAAGVADATPSQGPPAWTPAFPADPRDAVASGGWAARGPGPDRPSAAPLPPAPLPARRLGRTAATTMAAAAVTLTGVLVWTLAPGGAHDDDRDSGSASSASTTPHATGSGTTSAGALASDGPASGSTRTPSSTTARPELLTPAGVRATIAAMRPFIIGTSVRKLVVYPEYATAEAPTPADPQLYDRIDYRDGTATPSPGGTMDSDDTTVILADFDWDVLPALLETARKTLNVPHPTSRYIIVGPDLFDETPTVSVYLSDDYGSGYLSADIHGMIVKSYPRGA